MHTYNWRIVKLFAKQCLWCKEHLKFVRILLAVVRSHTPNWQVGDRIHTHLLWTPLKRKFEGKTTSWTCCKIQTRVAFLLPLHTLHSSKLDCCFPYLEKLNSLQAISSEPRATIKEREIDVCLIYKHYIQAQEREQKETVCTHKAFPAPLQLSFRLRHYQNLWGFVLHTKIVFNNNGVQEKCAGKVKMSL